MLRRCASAWLHAFSFLSLEWKKKIFFCCEKLCIPWRWLILGMIFLCKCCERPQPARLDNLVSVCVCVCLCLVGWWVGCTSRINTWPTWTSLTDAFKSGSQTARLTYFCFCDIVGKNKQKSPIASNLKPNLCNGNTSVDINLSAVVLLFGWVFVFCEIQTCRASKNTNCSATLHTSSPTTTTTPPTTSCWPTVQA